MDIFLLIVSVVLCVFYLMLIVGLTIGLHIPCPQNTSIASIKVSVIVPARNEAHNIIDCLKALAAQTYPTHLTEIIVVDDRSTDATAKLVRQFMVHMPHLKLASVSSQKHACPKKNALQTGIEISSGDIVLTTDADCRPGPKWIAVMVGAFTPDTGMIIGFAPLKTEGGFFQSLLSLQGLVVAALSAGSVGMGLPLTCTGRNLSYRRQAFNDAKGFETIGHITGGDDVLLMRKVAQTRWKIQFNMAPEAAVVSNLHLDNQLNRQVRYQSKAIHYGIPTLILALAIYIFHFILFLYPVLAWVYPALRLPIGVCLVFKIVADMGFLFLAARRLKSPFPILQALLLDILLFPYIVVFCALGVFAPFKWK